MQILTYAGGIRGTRERADRLGDQQAQSSVRVQPVGRQDEENGADLRFEILEPEVRALQHQGHAQAVEEMGVALDGREDALVAALLERGGVVTAKDFGDILGVFATTVAEAYPDEGDILAVWAGAVKYSAPIKREVALADI